DFGRFHGPDHRDLDLPREGQLVGDLARDLAGQLDGAQVIDLALAHVDADLAAALHGDGAVHAAEAAADPLEVFEARRVVLLLLAAGARARAAHRVGGGHEVSVQRVGRLVGVVRADGVGDDLGLAEAARVVRADHGVRALDLVRERLADVV